MIGASGRTARRQNLAIEELYAAIIGGRLTGVSYVVAEGDVWPSGHSADPRVHEIDMGLVLHVGDTALNVTWVMDGHDEGLAVVAGAALPDFFGISTTNIDVGHVMPWPSLVEHKVADLAWAWHQPYEDCAELLWAMRIRFDFAGSAVIALGDFSNGVPQYLPDSMLAIFDEDLARFYSIPAGEGPAWGDVIDLHTLEPP
jgi:hypothetical protein